MARIVTNTRPTNQNSNADTSKREAQLWLNVGYTMHDPETGEELFISMPLGIPLDTQAEVKVRGKDASTRDMLNRKNLLLKDLLGIGDQLEPGQGEAIEGLEIQIRRIADKQEQPESTNVDRPQINLVPRSDAA